VALPGAEADDERSVAKDTSSGMVGASSSDGDISTYLRVAASSDPFVVAGAIAKKTRRGEEVDLLAIGGGAVYMCVRALAQARVFLMEDNVRLHFVPSFVHLELDGEAKSARSGIRFMCVPAMSGPVLGRIDNAKAKRSTNAKVDEKMAEDDKGAKERQAGAVAPAAEEKEEVPVDYTGQPQERRGGSESRSPSRGSS
jgi:stage V sporulation protein S